MKNILKASEKRPRMPTNRCLYQTSVNILKNEFAKTMKVPPIKSYNILEIK